MTGADQDIQKLMDFLGQSDPDLAVFFMAILSSYFMEPQDPGIYVASTTGFSWTKTVDINSSSALDLGFGTLRFDGDCFNVTVGVGLDPGGDIRHVHMTAQALAGTNSVTLALSDDFKLKQADPILTPNPNSGQEELTGFGPVEDLPIELTLPCIGFAVDIMRLADDTVDSRLYQIGTNGETSPFYLTLDPGRVLIVPSLNNIGVYARELILDLSGDEVDSRLPLVPGVTDAGWKGLYARELDIAFKEANHFYRVGAGDLTIGTNGLNADFHFLYDADDPTKLLKSVSGSLRIRDNELVDTDLEVSLFFAALLNETVTDTPPQTPGLSQDKAQETRTKLNERIATDGLALGGVVTFGAEVFSDTGKGLRGLEFRLKAMTFNDAPYRRTEAGFLLEGEVARWVFYALGYAGALAMLIYGIAEDDMGLIWGGSGLLLLTSLDVIFHGNDPVYPNSLVLNKLSFRWIGWQQDGQARNTYQFGWSMGVNYVFTEEAWENFYNLLFGEWGAKLFGDALSEIKLTGMLSLQVDNVVVNWGDDLTDRAKADLAALTHDNDYSIKATSLPDITLTTRDQDDWPVTIRVNRIEAVVEDDAYGVAIYFDGIGGTVHLAVPPGGIVIYLYPDVDIAFKPPALNAAPFMMCVPGVCLVKGSVAVDQPIPSGGSQNKIDADVGILVREPSLPSDEIDSYKFRFGGLVAWGHAGIDPDTYKFWFFYVYYSGDVPLVSFGVASLYGLALFGGHNVGPGFKGNKHDALGLLNWLVPNPLRPNFSQLKTWEPSDDTWHPEKNSDCFGGFLELRDAGKTVVGEIGMLGGSGAWYSLAGVAKIQSLDLAVAAVLLYYDPDTLFRAAAACDVEDVVKLRGHLELAHVGGSYHFFVGHYSEEKGGPVHVEILDFLTARGYVVFDETGLEDFGLVCDPDQFKPTISGPAYGLGAIAEFDPGQIGPDWLHIRVYAGIGFNCGFRFDPFFIYGDLYTTGYVKIKVFWFSFKFGMYARLAGMADADGVYYFAGEFGISIGLPWPLPDVDVSVDFSLGSNNVQIQPPTLTSQLRARYNFDTRTIPLGHGAQGEAFAEDADGQSVPIDGILNVGFDKPMEYLTGQSATFPMLTESPTSGRFRERIDTTVASSGKTYTIIYSYHLDAFRLRNKSKRRNVQALPGFWINPIDDQDTTGFAHMAMDLGAWDYASEQYVMPHRMGDYWQNYQGVHTYPCQTVKQACIFEGTYPNIIEETIRYGAFDTVLGEIRIQEAEDYESPYFWETNQRLAWDDGDPNTPLPPIDQASTTRALLLPFRSYVDVPPCTEVRFRLHVTTLNAIRFIFDVKLHDHEFPDQVIMNVNQATIQIGQAADSERRFQSNATVNAPLGHIAVTLTATEGHLIERIGIHGPTFVTAMTAGHMEAAAAMSVHNPVLPPQIEPRTCRLQQLCITLGQKRNESWESNVSGFLGSVDPENLSLVWDTFLLDPNSAYELTFAMRWRGEVEGTDKAADNWKAPDYTTLRFRTEEHPSQDAAKYVAYTSPGEGLPPVYPYHAALGIGLKYQGLLRAIYDKHYGEDSLQVRIMDMNDRLLAPDTDFVLEINNGMGDQYVEDVLAHCLEDLAGVTFTLGFTWTIEPAVNARFSIVLRLKDDAQVPDDYDRVRFSAPFRTSRYRTFADHIGAMTAALEDMTVYPALPTAAGAPLPLDTLTALVNEVRAGTRPGFDHLIEAIGEQVLGVEGGWLNGGPGVQQADAATCMVHEAGGVRTRLGAIVELMEPFMDKPGFAFPNADETDKDKGLLYRGNHVIVFDASMTRLAILQRSGNAIVALVNAPSWDVRFDPSAAIPASVRATLLQKLEPIVDTMNRYTQEVYATIGSLLPEI